MKVVLTTFVTAVVGLGAATIVPSLMVSRSLAADLTWPKHETLILAQSTEFIRNEITRYYRDLLGREPDTKGLNYHVQKVLQGRSLVQVRRDLAISPEGQHIANLIQSASFGGRVRQTYLEVLGREPDAAGLAFHVRLLEISSLDAVKKSLLASPEGRNLSINQVYREVWGSDADESTLSFYRDRMGKDGWSLDKVRADMVAKRQAPTTSTASPSPSAVATGLPTLPPATGAPNADSYYVIIPQSSGGNLNEISSKIEALKIPRENVLIRQIPRGPHVAVGPFRDRKLANEWTRFLRGKGFDARLYYGR